MVMFLFFLFGLSLVADVHLDDHFPCANEQPGEGRALTSFRWLRTCFQKLATDLFFFEARRKGSFLDQLFRTETWTTKSRSWQR